MSELSKGELVEQWFKKHGPQTAQQVIEGLGEQGVTVSLPTVQSVKKKLGMVKSRGGEAATPAPAPSVASPAAPQIANGSNRAADLEKFASILSKAHALAKECGGIGPAIEILKTIAEAGK